MQSTLYWLYSLTFSQMKAFCRGEHLVKITDFLLINELYVGLSGDAEEQLVVFLQQVSHAGTIDQQDVVIDLVAELDKVVVQLEWFYTVLDAEYLFVLCSDSWCSCDAFSCLHLVACQHPYLNACIPDGLYSFAYVFL